MSKFLRKEDQSGSSSNCRSDKNSETQTNPDPSQRKEFAKKDNKKLSFFHSDEDGSDESSSSPDQLRPSSGKWTSGPRKLRANSYNTNTNNNNNNNNNTEVKNHGSCKPKEVIKHAEDVPLDQDDACSTSSCSCEDHSSVAGRPEDYHEVLDYDEDSITNSPTQLLTNKPAIATTSSSDPLSQNNDEQSASPPADSNLPDSDELGESDARGKKQTKESDEKIASEHGSQSVSNSRIKSVINLSHNQEILESNTSNHGGSKSTHDRSHKSYDCLLKYFFKDACFFQIKSINHENVELSKSLGVWSTPVQNEIKLNTAFREHRNVILIFSVQQSGGFQGFARMISKSKAINRVIPWVLPERMSNRSLGGTFKVEWLCTKKLPFHETNDLANPFNENKPVKVARDGQQVEQKVGKKLCRLFPHDSKERLLTGISTLKRQTSLKKKSPQRYDNLYAIDNWRSDIDAGYRHAYVSLQSFGAESTPPIHAGQKQLNYTPPNHTYRSDSRRRYQGPPTRSIYPRYNHQCPMAYPGPMRPHQIHRDVISRWPVPDVQCNFHQNQPYLLYPSSRFTSQQNNWGPNASVDRYFPYQRPRR